MASDSEVKLDKAKGEIVFPRGRAFLLGTDVWSAMKVKQQWDPVTVENLKRQWVSYGKELGNRMWAILGKELDMTYDILEESAMEAGWGILRIEGDKVHGTHLTFTLTNCVFCEGLKGKVKEPSCYELSGTIQGVVEVIHGVRTVEEAKCASGSGDACVVEVRQ